MLRPIPSLGGRGSPSSSASYSPLPRGRLLLASFLPRVAWVFDSQLSIHVAEEMEGKLVVLDSCSHIPMDEKSEVSESDALCGSYRVRQDELSEKGARADE